MQESIDFKRRAPTGKRMLLESDSERGSVMIENRYAQDSEVVQRNNQTDLASVILTNQNKEKEKSQNILAKIREREQRF